MAPGDDPKVEPLLRVASSPTPLDVCHRALVAAARRCNLTAAIRDLEAESTQDLDLPARAARVLRGIASTHGDAG